MFKLVDRYLFYFSWKSLQRHSGRSFFIALSVSLAVMTAIWVMAFFGGMNTQIEQAVINTNIGDFQIQEPVYAKTTDSTSPKVLTEKLKRKLKDPAIRAFSPELVLDGNISTPEGATGLTVLGIIPDFHKSFLPLDKNVISGDFITSNGLGDVIIGEELAKAFKFKIHDQIVLNYQDQEGALRSEILNIKGIYRYNGKAFEKRYIYINQKSWQNLFFNDTKNEILFNRIPIMLKHETSINEFETIIKDPELTYKTWKDLNPEMAVVLDFHDGMINFFFLIIGVTITLTILTPVRMLWQERLKELKMMNIIGVSIKNFWKIGLYEIFLMMLLSTTLASILILIIIGYQSFSGIDFSSFAGGTSIERAGIMLPQVIYPILSTGQLAVTFLFVAIVLSISYVWSIRRTLIQIEDKR